MTKNELIGLLNMNMMDSIRKRDKTDPQQEDEEYGYHNGQYRAYESVINLLTMMDITEISPGDTRAIHR